MFNFDGKRRCGFREAVLVKNLKETYPVSDRLLVINAMGDGDEVVARAWCSERGKHAVIRRDIPGKECCFACACNLAAGDTGLNCNVLIWGQVTRMPRFGNTKAIMMNDTRIPFPPSFLEADCDAMPAQLSFNLIKDSGAQ